MLRLLTFGGVSLERDGVRFDTVASHRKGLALLAVVAAAGERGISRDSVLGLFWPESGDERARTSLRQTVHMLRNQLGTPDLFAPSPELRLNTQIITGDVIDFRDAIASGDFEAAAALYRGPWLEGFFLRGTDELERWIAAERASLANAAARALETLAERAEQGGDPRAATGWWRRLTELEPLSSRAAVGLMRRLDAIGERPAALRHARVHELLVQNEIGEATDGSVAAFAETLRASPPVASIEPDAAAAGSDNGPTPIATPASPPDLASDGARAEAVSADAREPSPRRRPIRAVVIAASVLVLLLAAGLALARLTGSDRGASLVVLPLSNTSGDADNDIISDGLTENLIAALAAIPDVRVIGRTSAFRFKQRTLDLRAIADSLGVSTVLDGSVQRAGQQLKISVQLVNAADGTVLWAETYDRQLHDFFAIQDDITLRSSAHCDRACTPQQAQRPLRARFAMYRPGTSTCAGVTSSRRAPTGKASSKSAVTLIARWNVIPSSLRHMPACRTFTRGSPYSRTRRPKTRSHVRGHTRARRSHSTARWPRRTRRSAMCTALRTMTGTRPTACSSVQSHCRRTTRSADCRTPCV